MAFDYSKFLARFVDEAREHCATISEGLLALDSAPGNVEAINALFRSAHTIKGSARMMKVLGVSELAHRMEDVLDGARSSRIPFTRALSQLLFKGVDCLLAMLDKVNAGEQPEAPLELREALVQAAAGGEPPKPAAEPVAAAPVAAAGGEPPKPAAPPTTLTEEQHKGALATGHTRSHEYLRVHADKLDDLIRLMGEIISEHGRFRKDVRQLKDIAADTERHLLAVAKGQGKQPDKGPGDSGARRRGAGNGAALQLSLRQTMRSVTDAVLMQEHLIGELQETSLKLRMLPLSTLFAPLRRTVWDMAQEFGKDIDFVVQGEETELDRKITERIGDPLMHMIRNALDHGLESPEERVAAGKPPRGNITLSAFYDGGCVTIALSDDGQGLSADRIREKALAKRLYSEESLARMSRAEIYNIIFLPGFSTSPVITDVSGRGVGMDVVRRNIVEELNGTISIETKEGQGTSFFLRLPLNLAVFPLFLVSAGGLICALPATSIVAMLAIARSEIIEILDKRAIRLREQIVPLEELAAILKFTGQAPAQTGTALVVIVRDGQEKLGLLVDEILGREEMVVKPLPPHMKNLRLVTGGTIGSGNSIINVLHVPELIRQAHGLADVGRMAADKDEKRGATILVVDDSINTREIERSILEAYGYTVETAEDGQEAFDRTRGQLFDLVITDVEMPRMDGFTLTEALRADPRYRNVPVVIVTSREKEEDKRRGITVGADAYIVKRAFDQSNLLDTVKSLIG